MNPSIFPLFQLAASLAIGLGSGWLGAWMGLRIAVVKLEMRQTVDSAAITRLAVDVSAHRDDLLFHDVEIGELYRDAGKERVRRQLAR